MRTGMQLTSFAVLLTTIAGLGWFVMAKPIQISREFQMNADMTLHQQAQADAAAYYKTNFPPEIPITWSHLLPKTMGEAVLSGILRRLDDVSFWNTVTAVIASFLMLRAWWRIANHPAGMTERLTVMKALSLWISVAAFLVGIYLVCIYKNHGTLFYGQQKMADATVTTLQYMEGVVNIVIISVAALLLPLGWHLVHVLHRGINAARPGDDCETLRRAAGALAGVVIAPMCSTLLAFAAWKGIRTWLPVQPEILGREEKWWIVVLFCSALWLQFVILGIRAYLRLRQHFKVKVDLKKSLIIALIGALTGIGSLVLYLVVDVEWRGRNPCEKEDGQ